MVLLKPEGKRGEGEGHAPTLDREEALIERGDGVCQSVVLRHQVVVQGGSSPLVTRRAVLHRQPPGAGFDQSRHRASTSQCTSCHRFSREREATRWS